MQVNALVCALSLVCMRKLYDVKEIKNQPSWGPNEGLCCREVTMNITDDFKWTSMLQSFQVLNLLH